MKHFETESHVTDWQIRIKQTTKISLIKSHSLSIDFRNRRHCVHDHRKRRKWQSAASTVFHSGMGDRLWAGIPPWYVTKPTRSTQPCIPLGSLNRVPASIGWGKGGNVTSAGWQVTLCDPIWHVSSRSGEACCELLYPVTLLYFTFAGTDCIICRIHTF